MEQNVKNEKDNKSDGKRYHKEESTILYKIILIIAVFVFSPNLKIDRL